MEWWTVVNGEKCCISCWRIGKNWKNIGIELRTLSKTKNNQSWFKQRKTNDSKIPKKNYPEYINNYQKKLKKWVKCILPFKQISSRKLLYNSNGNLKYTKHV